MSKQKNRRWRSRNKNRRKRYAKHKRRRNKRAVEPAKPPIPDRLQELRERVWGAMGIASCVQYASDSMLAPKLGKPDIQQTMVALFDLLGEVSGPLEDIIEELGGVTEEDDQ